MDLFGKIKNWANAEDEEFEEEMDMEEESSGSSIISQQTKAGMNIGASGQLQVVICKPEVFESASEIADHLKDRKTVVLNLEYTNKDTARRLVDFMCGVAYAIGGKMKQIANNTFIVTPFNVGLMGDIIDELENSGAFY